MDKDSRQRIKVGRRIQRLKNKEASRDSIQSVKRATVSNQFDKLKDAILKHRVIAVFVLLCIVLITIGDFINLVFNLYDRLFLSSEEHQSNKNTESRTAADSAINSETDKTQSKDDDGKKISATEYSRGALEASHSSSDDSKKGEAPRNVVKTLSIIEGEKQDTSLSKNKGVAPILLPQMEVTLIIPEVMIGGEIFIDNKPATIVKDARTIITIRVEKKLPNQLITIRKGKIKCWDIIPISDQKIPIKPCAKNMEEEK